MTLGVSIACAAVALASLAAAPARGQAAPAAEDAPAKLTYSGVTLFRTYCATCHGKGGQGDGPLADQLRYRPPDLTLLAKRNDGTFDADAVYRVIDGRNPLKGHGGADMPVWGDAFKNVSDGYDEAAVKARIQAIVGFLEGLQERAPRKD